MPNFLNFFSSLLLVTFANFIVCDTDAINFVPKYKDSSVIERFRNWVDAHRIIPTSEHHFAHIFENWLGNDKYIEEINAKNLSYTLGHNAYSGMDVEEFSQYMGFGTNQEMFAKGMKNLRGSVPSVGQEEIQEIQDTDALSQSLDWRTKGAVSAIRNQESCGSCWAFSGTSTLESASAIKYGKLYDLSEQQSVSCAGLRYGNLGCNGGYYSGLFDYSKNNGGICTEASYPYTSGNGDTGDCVKKCSPVSGTQVKSYVDVTPNSDNAMMNALNVNPVSIAIEADTRSFQLYSGGVYTDYEGCNKNSGKGSDTLPNIDHAVVLVGYGTQNGQDYYILRNSWGESWGGSEKGYMLIGRGAQYGTYGMCGVLYDPMYPVV